MTDEEILEKAINKAIDGGWKPGWLDRRPVVSWGAQYSTDYDEGEGVMVIGYHAKSNASRWFFPIKELLFEHNFARALWRERIEHGWGLWHSAENAWQYHLQMMVIAPDPIKYLGENI